MGTLSKWVNRKLRGLPSPDELAKWGPHPLGWTETGNIATAFGEMANFQDKIGRSFRGIGRAGARNQITADVFGGFEQMSRVQGVAPLGGRTHGPSGVIPPGRGARNPWYRQVNKWVGNYKPGVSSTRRTVSRALKSPGSPLSLAFSALAAYQGYQEGGISGAASYVAQGAAFEVGSSILAQTIGATGAGLLGAGAAVTMGTYEALEYGNRYMKRRTRSEMSAPFVDKFGTLATMRQRSLQAMRDSHLNMRSALGNEATLMHR